MRTVLLTLATLAALGVAGAAAVVGLGLYNVSAQVGHLPGVSWVLHTTFRQSVKLRAKQPERLPDLSDPALIELGARHYATACHPCHAAPGETRTATVRAMKPEPPHIKEAVGDWAPHELHWIVSEGIKMSGMPAWPAKHREDEVWAVVAYLAAVRDGLSDERQSGLTALPASDGPDGAAYCSGCHGRVEAHVPRLDILTTGQIAHALDAYREGVRASGIMQQAATRPSPQDLAELAQFYGGMEPDGRAEPGGAAADRGEALARRGTEEVPSCTSCHGPDAPEEARDYPSLAGQDRAYLAAQLRLWRDGVRHGAQKMTLAARALDEDQIAALSAWYASLAPVRNQSAE